MRKTWKLVVCTKTKVNESARFFEGSTYFERPTEDGEVELIDEDGKTIVCSQETYTQIFGKKINQEKVKNIQAIFGGGWVELSRQELELKKRLGNSKVCKDLEEALNPDNWDNLGAGEVWKRIREFQELLINGE